MSFKLLDIGIGSLRFSSWHGLYFSGSLFVLFSLVMWFAEKPLESFFEDEVAGAEICRRISNWEEPRLNLSVRADGYGMLKNCQAQLEGYIPKNARLASVSGKIQFFEGTRSLDVSGPVQLSLREGGTGMKSAKIALPQVTGKACKGLRLELELTRCFSSTGQRIDCPKVRVADNLAFEDLRVGGEDVRVCYDE